MSSSPDRTFRTRLSLHAPRARVFEAISTPTGTQQWFAPEVAADLRVGGTVVWDWPGHHRWEQTIELFEPGARLRTRYDSSVPDGKGGKVPLFLDFACAEADGGTLLTLTQSGFGPGPEFDEELRSISRGWPVELRSLQHYVECHPGATRQLAWATRDVAMDVTDAWQQLTGPAGFDCGTVIETYRDGEPFAIRSETGGLLEGDAVCCHSQQFSGIVHNFGGAFCRISVEEWGGLAHVWLWLGAYGQDPAAIAGLQARWEALLAGAFPDPA